MGAATGPSIGLAMEIRPSRFVSAEIIPDLNFNGYFPFQARLKVYPIQSIDIFLGGGYYHAGSYGREGYYFDGSYPGVYNFSAEYNTYSGHEFFLGWKLPRMLVIETGYRLSDAPWKTEYINHSYYDTKNTYLRELYITFTFTWLTF